MGFGIWNFPLCAAEKTPAAKATPADPIESNLRTGQELFQKKLYAAALEKFTLALAIKPDHRNARLLAGLAAYWAQQPELALEHWNALLDTAPRNSLEEWRLETQRVMALYALGHTEAAEAVVARIYELRPKVAEAKKARGFTREHIYIGDLRAGCWEEFDDRKEAQHVWTLPVTALKLPGEPVVAHLSLSAAVLPGGEAGFVLDEEGLGYTRVYQRWLKRPEYAEFRALALQALKGKLKPLEETAVENADRYPDAPVPQASRLPVPQAAEVGKPSPAQQEPSAPKVRVLTPAEESLAAKALSLGLDPAAAQILSVASRLRDVEFGVTRLTRLSLTDKLLTQRYLQELNAKSPYAQEDAGELVELIAKAKAEHVRDALGKLSKLSARKPYLDYALLTAFNTRGRDVPLALLKELLKSPDFMVRQTAALLQSRAGDKRGLALLFKELESADALGCAILHGSLAEQLGAFIPAPPPARSASEGAGLSDAEKQALKTWQQQAAKWWQERGGKLTFVPGAGGEPNWK